MLINSHFGKNNKQKYFVYILQVHVYVKDFYICLLSLDIKASLQDTAIGRYDTRHFSFYNSGQCLAPSQFKIVLTKRQKKLQFQKRFHKI